MVCYTMSSQQSCVSRLFCRAKLKLLPGWTYQVIVLFNVHHLHAQLRDLLGVGVAGHLQVGHRQRPEGRVERGRQVGPAKIVGCHGRQHLDDGLHHGGARLDVALRLQCKHIPVKHIPTPAINVL